jgi:hypothetical protein
MFELCDKLASKPTSVNKWPYIHYISYFVYDQSCNSTIRTSRSRQTDNIDWLYRVWIASTCVCISMDGECAMYSEADQYDPVLPGNRETTGVTKNEEKFAIKENARA